MKREYVKPVMESEMFVANEYVAACTLTKLTCFGGFPSDYSEPYILVARAEYWDSTTLPTGNDIAHEYGYNFKPCGETFDFIAEKETIYSVFNVYDEEYDGETYVNKEAIRNLNDVNGDHPFHIGLTEPYDFSNAS